MASSGDSWLRTWILAGVWGVLLLGLWAVSRSPELREWWCVDGPGAQASRGIAEVTAVFPFSVAEAGELALGFGVVVWLLIRLFEAITRSTGRGAWMRGLRMLIRWGGLGLVLFYGLWGLNYSRSPLDVRLGWPEGGGTTTTGELESLAVLLRSAANEDYLELHGVEDLGVATPLPPRDRLDAALVLAWPRVEAVLGLPKGFGRVWPPAKPREILIVYEKLNLLGMYNPFSAEAQFNGVAPPIQLGVAIAHEGAHQRGIAPEDEANFIGFVCALMADDPFFRYSARLFAHRQLTREVQRLDVERAQEIIAGRLPGVQRDVVEAARHWERHAGLVADAGRSLNDAYLKTNGVEDGVEAYSRSAALILAWWRIDPDAVLGDGW